MDHRRDTVAKAALAVALIVLSAPAQAAVTWNIVGTDSQGGEPDLVGTVTTPDFPFNCALGPPADCPISGTLTFPAGSLGGPGSTIDLAVDPVSATVSISTSPPSADDNFSLFGISTVDGYTCNSIAPFTLQCVNPTLGTSADFVLDLQLPHVAIGNGNIVMTGQLLVAGQIIAPAEPTLYSIGDTGPAGGIVFYVTDGGLHGLEAALEDQTSVRWCLDPFPSPDIAGVYSIAQTNIPDYHSGVHNTPRIEAVCGATSAAAIAAAYVWPNGQTDGFLPNNKELDLMYWNLHVAGMGGFANTNGFYWSSSEVNAAEALFINFDIGLHLDGLKVDTFRMRTVRAF